MAFSPTSLLCLLVLAVCAGCASVPKAPTPPSQAGPITTGEATINVGQQACSPQQTLPEFLGLTGLAKAGCGAIDGMRNCLGQYFPGLEAKPSMLAISDPANLESPSPAVATAAEAKAQEDAAPGKIKALRYVAGIGCGECYPDIEQSFLAALDDCTESVRFEAAKAIRKTAGNPCQSCRDGTCCSPAIREKLNELGYGTSENTNCFKEPSDRVRRMARLALCGCGGEAQPPGKPKEGPSQADVPAEAPATQEQVASLWDNHLGAMIGRPVPENVSHQGLQPSEPWNDKPEVIPRPNNTANWPLVSQRLPYQLQSGGGGLPNRARIAPISR